MLARCLLWVLALAGVLGLEGLEILEWHGRRENLGELVDCSCRHSPSIVPNCRGNEFRKQSESQCLEQQVPDGIQVSGRGIPSALCYFLCLKHKYTNCFYKYSIELAPFCSEPTISSTTHGPYG